MHELLKGLVRFAIDRAEEYIEDVESFLPDVKSVLGEVGSLAYTII